MENSNTNSNQQVSNNDNEIAILNLEEFLIKNCIDYEIRINDLQPKILFKTGVTLEFLQKLNKFVKVKLIVSTYKTSRFFRNGFNLIIFIHTY